MKSFLLLLLSFVVVQSVHAVQTMELTDEEVRLVQAYRKDPTLFRQILRGSNGGANQLTVGGEVAVLGPRDVVDVSIIGGKVQFYGKPGVFEPVSFRISRGETKSVTFRKKDAITETRVVVSYRSDGFHFDVPEAYGGTTSEEAGLLVIPEGGAWDNGEVQSFPGSLPGKAHRGTSRAEDLQIKVRYALLTGHKGKH